MDARIDRRRFLATGALAAGGLVCGDWTPAQAADLPRRQLGRTGLAVSVVTCGACDNRRLIDEALDLGINLFHTSLAYKNGLCVEALGQVARSKRDQMVIALKENPRYGGFTDALRKLQTDHIDVVLAPAEPTSQYDDRTIAAFEAKRRAGQARFLGYAGHDQMAERVRCRMTPAWSCALLAYNLTCRAELDPVLQRAAELTGIGFLTMKSARGAQGDRPTQWATGVRTALANPHMASCLISVDSSEKLRAAVRAASERQQAAVTPDEERAAQRLCSLCGACQRACPQGLALADYRRAELYGERGDPGLAVETLAALPLARSVSACARCAVCAEACPRRLAAPEVWRDLADRWA